MYMYMYVDNEQSYTHMQCSTYIHALQTHTAHTVSIQSMAITQHISNYAHMQCVQLFNIIPANMYGHTYMYMTCSTSIHVHVCTCTCVHGRTIEVDKEDHEGVDDDLISSAGRGPLTSWLLVLTDYGLNTLYTNNNACSTFSCRYIVYIQCTCITYYLNQALTGIWSGDKVHVLGVCGIRE